jgi:membrane protease YdiL (CAAX protease family)
MTGQVQSPLGAVVLGASAGIGEEAIFRGALQPRFGLVIPSLLFTMLHGPQYGFNVALLGLFGVSVILGLERKYVNTTAAMITHALYNALQVLALSMVS